MLTVEEFVVKFGKYSDQELFEMLQNIEGYSEDAKKAINQVIEVKGGFNKLTGSIAEYEQISIETKKIQKEIYELGQAGFDQEFIRKAVFSNLLSEERLHEIINKHYDYSIKDIEDKSIDTQTIGRCIMAGAIAILISGSTLGGLLIYTQAIHILIIVGVALLCYAIIKGIVKKSKNNKAVIMTTVVLTILAIAFGFLLFEFFVQG